MRVARSSAERQPSLEHIEEREFLEKIRRGNDSVDLGDGKSFDDAIQELAAIDELARTRVSAMVTRKEHQLTIGRYRLVWPAAGRESLTNGLGTPHSMRHDARPAGVMKPIGTHLRKVTLGLYANS